MKFSNAESAAVALRGPLFLAAALVVGSCVHRLTEGENASRNIVFSARLIRTMNPAQPTVDALVMRDGKIVFAGSKAEAIQMAGPGAPVETFEGSTIVPGLIDAHGHLAALGQALTMARLGSAKTEADAAALVAKAKDNDLAKQGDWLIGGEWDQNDWVSKAYPTRTSLDAVVSAKVPVLLWRIDGHALWVNSEALARAGITRATKDPEGGRIERDAKGEPTGVLVDNATDLLMSHVPAASEEVAQRQMKLALELCAKLGLTQVHDAGTGMAAFQLLQNWDAMGRLPIRIYAMARGQGAEGQEYLDRGPFGGRHLEMRAVKLAADGALGSRGAALKASYSDAAGELGLMLLNADQLTTKAGEFSARGFQVAVHAIGDRANALTIGVLSNLKPNRHRVEHAQILSAEEVPRFAKFGLIASFQPTHATSDMPWAEARLGPERLKFAYAWRAVLETGAHIAFGSDFPVESPNPLWGIYAARTRQDHQGQPPGGWHADQKVSGLEALAAFTTGAAYASFAETHRGQLAVGFDADFVVLPVDPVEDPPEKLLDAKVQVTVVDGVDVYRAP